jgi:hypothetical protein
VVGFFWNFFCGLTQGSFNILNIVHNSNSSNPFIDNRTSAMLERFLSVYTEVPFDPNQVDDSVLWRTKSLRRLLEGRTTLPAYPTVAPNVPHLGDGFCLNCAGPLRAGGDEREVKVHDKVTCPFCAAALRRVLREWAAERWPQEVQSTSEQVETE